MIYLEKKNSRSSKRGTKTMQRKHLMISFEYDKEKYDTALPTSITSLQNIDITLPHIKDIFKPHSGYKHTRTYFDASSYQTKTTCNDF